MDTAVKAGNVTGSNPTTVTEGGNTVVVVIPAESVVSRYKVLVVP